MPAKKWTSKKKVTKVEETPEVIEKTPVTTVEENEISDTEPEAGTIIQEEEEIFLKKTNKRKNKVIGDISGTIVEKPQGRIKFEAQVAPYPMFLLPSDIRQWLISNGLTSDVYKKDKEWLERHHVNMEMVEKLKQFLTERL